MWHNSLWTKSIVSLLLGFLLSMSFFVNIGFVAPIPRDIFLMVAVLGGFIVWGAIISYFFCVSSIKKPSLICLGTFSISAAINACFYIGL